MPVHCTCEGKCATRSCPCYKNNRRCSKFCHSKHEHVCNINEYKKGSTMKGKHSKKHMTRKHRK